MSGCGCSGSRSGTSGGTDRTARHDPQATGSGATTPAPEPDRTGTASR